jgi:hypothetical protein
VWIGQKHETSIVMGPRGKFLLISTIDER